MSKGFAPASETQQTPDTETVDALPADQLKFNTLMLEEFQLRLPIGIFVGGRRLQNFTLKEITGEIDLFLRRLSAKTSAHKKLAKLFVKMVDSIGDYSVPDLARELSCSPEQMFERMFVADAITILLNLRLFKQDGYKLFLQGQCPQCQTTAKDTEDSYHELNSLEINVPPMKWRYPEVVYRLEEPFNILGKEANDPEYMVYRLYLRPLRLFELEKLLPGNANPDMLPLLILYKMVCRLPDVEEYATLTSGIMTDDVYVLMGERDRNQMLALSEKLMQVGPNIQIQMECDNPVCGFHWQQALQWGDLTTFLLGLNRPS